MSIDSTPASYRYFVSYLFNEEKKNTGYGCTEIFTASPITDFKTVKDFCQIIAKSHQLDGVVILNYQLLRVDNEDHSA